MAKLNKRDDPKMGRTGGHVVGMFETRNEAESAIDALKRAGFDDDQISVAMRDEKSARSLREDTGTEAADGAAAGAVSGGVVGGTLGLLAGLGAIAIPGIGPIVAAGWLGSTLLGAGVGAAAGGLIGGLVGMGIPEEDARRFDTAFREGGILVAVDAGVNGAQAESILRTHGADVSRGAMANRETGQRNLELREEELDINKRRVHTGDVNVRKEVITETQTVDVPVSREELVVERHPADRQEASGPVGESENIRIPLSEEKVDVSKRTVAREDVSVGKRQVTGTKRVTDRVRREELRVNDEVGPLAGSPTGKERRRHTGRSSYSGPERRQAQI